MQFTTRGPDVPDALLLGHEEGRVVFFCGAGISYPAGLPGFEGLVDKIYSHVGATPTDIEQDAYDRKQFDATLDLLERRLPGQRIAVRTALAEALKPKLRRKGATDTHTALLRLAQNREGTLRLVTTNFDRVFESAARRSQQKISSYAAPMLPIPKNSRWNGLVYLHGLLPKSPDNSELNRLVVTSGDFGLAYLTERWAARFVSELFRNYVICFVGYSINDPILRYMMDALAADRMLGEVTPQAYALGDCEPGQECNKTKEWEAKGVVPILYEVPAGSNDHSALHRTLKVWAETYRDGILGKERIVTDYAMAKPSASTQQDDYVNRMLWALSHESGLPAKRFADFNPAPSLAWLEAFYDDCYRHSDLGRFGIPPKTEVDDKLHFSLIRRPAPYTLAPWMSLVSGVAADRQWDDVMFHLARWLVRHLNDPALIIWLAHRGGQLPHRLAMLIQNNLDQLARLEEEKSAELAEIRANAPNAIPQPQMKTLWRLMLADRVKSPSPDLIVFYWKKHFKRTGLTATLRLELRELLAPKIVLKKPFHLSESSDPAAPESLKSLVNWELVLANDRVYSLPRDLSGTEPWRSALPTLVDDFQQLLRDALGLLSELGDADERYDHSYWALPSIRDHWQNRISRNWTMLIKLLRDAWLATRETDSARAKRIAQEWFSLPYPTFKRLALFAASHEGCIAEKEWADWLGADNARWLWSTETKRETMRLLVLQGTRLSSDSREKLELDILGGPPRAMYQDELESESWQNLVDYAVWLRLAKLGQGGSCLGIAAQQRFDALSMANPEWKLSQQHEREEFSTWMSGTGDPDFEDNRVIHIAPRKREDLVEWLKQSPTPDRNRLFEEDTWQDTCRTRFFHGCYALCDLAQEGIWPTNRWREALQVWSERGEGRPLRSWRFAAPLVQTMPDEVMEEILHSVAWWLETISKTIDRHEEILLSLCHRVLEAPQQNSTDNDRPVSRAMNHPIGQVTQALLNLWFKREPNDNDTLPSDIEPTFTKLCDTGMEEFRHGRVILASNLIALFRVDRPWTEKHLLPMFDWSHDPIEAKAGWEGFFWSPRLYWPLLTALKAQFLSTAQHYQNLREHGGQFAAFLVYAALDPAEGYSPQDFQEAFDLLPPEGLQEAAEALPQILEGAGEQREEFWKNRIHPFWNNVWPKSRSLASPEIASSLASLSIAAGKEFPTALAAVQAWLEPSIDHPQHIVSLLKESGLASVFPKDALLLLNAVLTDQPWVLEVGECLQAIKEADPDLAQDLRYQRLVEYSRQRDLT